MKLGDLGVSRLVWSWDELSVDGNARYRAPEMASKRYDGRVDVYSFGVMFCEVACKVRLPCVVIQMSCCDFSV